MALECGVKGGLRTDLKEREFYFYKESWKEGTSIYFGLDKGKVYYAIKTKESLDGKLSRKYIWNIYLKKE